MLQIIKGRYEILGLCGYTVSNETLQFGEY